MTDADTIDPVKLTAHIEERFHARHREQLPPLVEMAAKVEAVHAGADGVPKGLSGQLRTLLGELEVHMRKEELILFPAMRRGGMPGIENPIAMMRADHGDHERGIAALKALTHDLALPEGACRTWTALYAGLGDFLSDFDEHLRIENEVLFPQFENHAAQ